VVPFFQTFFDFSFGKPVICQDRSEQVSFQNFLEWFGFFLFFCDLAENQLIPNKYLSKKAPNGSDFFEFSRKIFFRRLGFHTSIFPETEDRGPLFLNFFSFFFPAAWVCGECKSQNEE
jgi:hypothetical protein